ncbi:MAG: type II toxin-antitoxin system RatA family toxin [Magnetococcus sp. WYHC-3]
MPIIRLHETVPFTPQQMYDLVVDVPRYPEFLPWCVATRVWDHEEHSFLAEMTVAFKGIREKFQTRDELVPGRAVKVTLHAGPFHHLVNDWRFQAVPGGASVDFFIDFKFKNRLMDLTLGPFFSRASAEMLAAFKQRAYQLHPIAS